jgi:hypothetical protein
MNTEQAFEISLIALEEKGFDAIREPEKVLATIWSIEAEVNNGGFDQYFYNSAGDLAFYSVKALETIGAIKMASITQKALDLFGESGPARDRDERLKQLETFSEIKEDYINGLDCSFTEYPDDLQEMVATYVQATF